MEQQLNGIGPETTDIAENDGSDTPETLMFSRSKRFYCREGLSAQDLMDDSGELVKIPALPRTKLDVKWRTQKSIHKALGNAESRRRHPKPRYNMTVTNGYSDKWSRPGEKPVDDDRPIKVICIGAGVSGILTAIKFPPKIKNLDLVIYEKSDDIGGTWHENRWVQSH